MDRHEADRERLIERICKLEPGRTADEFELLSLAELGALLRLAESADLQRQQRFAAGR